MPDDTRIPLGQQTGSAARVGGRPTGPRASAVLAARRAWGQPSPAAAPPPPPDALYIHTPFCSHKCHYCDFYSFVDTRDQQPAFVARLLAELAALAPAAHDTGGRRVRLRSIFVGGGTPSLLAVPLWERLLDGLAGLFDLSGMTAAGGAPGEFTVECNPESLSPELARTLRAGGVNRVSMGAQSFDRAHLATLERRHDPAAVARALEASRAAGIPRDSVDLIFGVPGQTLGQWRADLEAALALGTSHLSCYNLTYEPNTAMTVRLRRGEFTPAGEDLEADMFTLTGDTLAEAGLERYEVSNYARPGHECRHNLTYWRQGQWLAAGPSAAGHLWASSQPRLGGWRWKNIANLGVYLDSATPPAPPAPDSPFASAGAAGDPTSPVTDLEPPSATRALRERLMTTLRLAEGLDATVALADAEAIEPGAAARLSATADRLAGDGLLEAAAARWRVTPKGWLLADWVARKLMAAVPDAGG